MTYDPETAEFFSDEVLSSPLPMLQYMNEKNPVQKYRQEKFGRDVFVVATYELVDKVLRDHQRFSSEMTKIYTAVAEGNDEVEAIYGSTWPEVPTLATSDEPDHTRLRALVQPAFQPRRIARMDSFIQEWVHRLIDGFIERGSCDFLREFAAPLPINSISDIVGFPPGRYDDLFEWGSSLQRRNGQSASPSEQIYDAKKVVELKAFLAELFEERAANPVDDLASDLITARVAGENPLSRAEILSTLLILLLAGQDTTRSTLMACMARLLTEPGVLERVSADPSLVPNFVEEVLRLDGAALALWRIAREDVELAGVQIPRGGIVFARVDAANRDPSMFVNPERFDLDRPNANRHLTFGMGIHYCIGLKLAKAQVYRSLPALLDRLQNLRLVPEKSDLRPNPHLVASCLRELHVEFTPGSRTGDPRPEGHS